MFYLYICLCEGAESWNNRLPCVCSELNLGSRRAVSTLNCGANSPAPIAFFLTAKLTGQLKVDEKQTFCSFKLLTFSRFVFHVLLSVTVNVSEKFKLFFLFNL